MLSFRQKVIALNPTYRSIRLLGVLYNDELGPLEITDQGGWQAALDVLRGDGYQIALVVIRPDMQVLAHRFLNFSETITIDRTQTIASMGAPLLA
jgi:hypothetical protein